MKSVFTDAQNKSYPFKYAAALYIPLLVGGTPADPNVAEGWIRSKVKDSEERIQELIAKTVLEMKVSTEEAIEIVNRKNVNVFKRDDEGLYIEGRHVKAAIKEAVSIAVAVKKLNQTGWGATRKWLTNFLPEHVFVLENELHLTKEDGTPVMEADGLLQQFPHTHYGSSIQYQEYIRDAVVNFTVISDHNFSESDWEMIWTTGENNGIGASRSQGYGTYSVIKWDKEVVSKEGVKRFDSDPTTLRARSKK